jgi:hypothetical protein
MSAHQNFWLERDLASQATLNKKIAVSNKSAAYGADCWLFHDNNAYYITDMHTKLLAIINQRHIHKVRFLTSNNAQAAKSSATADKKPTQTAPKLARINLKMYSYSSMSNFLNQTPATRNSLVKNRPLGTTSASNRQVGSTFYS